MATAKNTVAKPEVSPEITDITRKMVGNTSENSEPVEYVDPFTGEVVTNNEQMIKRVDLDSLDFTKLSTEEFAELGTSLGLTLDDISALVDRWPLFDKADLARSETPLEILQWKFGEGRFAKPGQTGFVMIWARRKDTGAQGTIYDGGTGIRDQMTALTARRLADGKPAYNFATVSKVTRSDYESENGPATTYYLS